MWEKNVSPQFLRKACECVFTGSVVTRDKNKRHLICTLTNLKMDRTKSPKFSVRPAEIYEPKSSETVSKFNLAEMECKTIFHYR